jgi:hypothetical protein
VLAAALQFAREQLRTPLAIVLILTLPAVFVWLAGDVLSEFARALGGDQLGDRATALGAGWGAAFVSGALGYFQIASSRDADRRLALAGLGTGRVAAARLVAALALGTVVAASAFAALVLQAGVAHPGHALIAIGAFVAVYLAIGAIVGSLVADPLSGSLALAFIFLVDVFSGPGMGNAGGPLTPSRSAGELLLSAGGGSGSPAAEWLGAGVTLAVALGVAATTFWLSARERTA